MSPMEDKIIPFEDLSPLAEKLHAAGKKIVTTNGCFDLIHWGHIKYLEEARGLGDLLLCGVNSDLSVKRLKGPQRPLWNEQIRALQLAALQAIDYVTIFHEETPLRFLEIVRPHLHVKGADYERKEIPEKKILSSQGGKLIFMPLVEGFSTTSLIQKLKLLSNE